MPEPGAVRCTECRDTGFVVGQDDAGRGIARPCSCRRERQRALRLASARIPPRYDHCDLDGRFEHHHESQRRAMAFAHRLVADFAQGPQRTRGLLLWGPCGVGKTHLAVGILRQLVLNYPVSGLFTEFSDLLRRLQDTFDRRSETPSATVIDPVVEAGVLVLDDLGCTRMTAWTSDVLGLVVNERYNANRLTIVTTNRPLRSAAGTSGPNTPESLADRITERLASRLQEMCFVVEMRGPDYRESVRAAGDDFRRRI